jgi:hypothetical protein
MTGIAAWAFTTIPPPAGPPSVNLGTAGTFTILASSGITIGAAGGVAGNIGLSASASTGLTGFALVPDPSGTFSTSAMISGKAYTADNAAPTPDMLAAATRDLVASYNDAAGRPDAVSLGSGELGGRVLAPGLYKWSAAALITTDTTLAGGQNDVWIFQIKGALSLAATAKVRLTGGAQAKNVFWQTLGAVALGANADLEGIVLSQAAVTTGAGATVNGRLLTLAAVTVAAGSVVSQPSP